VLQSTLLALFTLGAVACEAIDLAGPGFHVTTDGAAARLDVAGDYDWSWNAMHDRLYDGSSAAFADASWWRRTATTAMTVIQSADGTLTSSLVVGHGLALRFGDGEFGPGWRALRGMKPERRFDLHAVGLVPDARRPGVDISTCDVDDTRMLVALSSYPGSMDDLIGLAAESAMARSAAAPTTWLEMVRDDRMYDLLFVDNVTHALPETTFAFVSLQIDPLCGDTRFTFRTEHGLVGPVARGVIR
jgi:hypothetical protein